MKLTFGRVGRDNCVSKRTVPPIIDPTNYEAEMARIRTPFDQRAGHVARIQNCEHSVSKLEEDRRGINAQIEAIEGQKERVMPFTHAMKAITQLTRTPIEFNPLTFTARRWRTSNRIRFPVFDRLNDAKGYVAAYNSTLDQTLSNVNPEDINPIINACLVLDKNFKCTYRWNAWDQTVYYNFRSSAPKVEVFEHNGKFYISSTGEVVTVRGGHETDYQSGLSILYNLENYFATRAKVEDTPENKERIRDLDAKITELEGRLSQVGRQRTQLGTYRSNAFLEIDASENQILASESEYARNHRVAKLRQAFDRVMEGSTKWFAIGTAALAALETYCMAKVIQNANTLENVGLEFVGILGVTIPLVVLIGTLVDKVTRLPQMPEETLEWGDLTKK